MFYINECADHEKATKIFCKAENVKEIITMINKRQNQLNIFLNISVKPYQNKKNLIELL